MRAVLILGLMAALGGAAAAAAPEARLGPEVSLANGSFTSGGGLTVATELRRRPQGGTALCGVWAESDSQTVFTTGVARGILDSASVYVEGRRIISGLGFLPKVAPRLDYAGAPARCVAVDLPWRDGRVAEVFLPRVAVTDAASGRGGNPVRFRQTGPGALGGSLEVIPLLRRQIGLVPLTPVATVAQGRYSSGGGLRVAAEIVPVRGQAHLCGVWSALPGQAPETEEVGRFLLREAEVSLGGRRLDVDMGALRRVNARNDDTGARANCLATGLPWEAGMTGAPLRIVLPERVVYRNTTPDGTRLIRFIPS